MVNSVLPLLRDKPVWKRRLALLSRNDSFFKWIEIACVLLLLAMMALAYQIITTNAANSKVLSALLAATLLLANLLPAMALIVLIGRRRARSRARAAERGGNGQLHVRLVGLFSLLAAIPTLLIVIFASFLFQYGMQFWFSDDSRSLFENSQDLAEGYYEQSFTRCQRPD